MCIHEANRVEQGMIQRKWMVLVIQTLGILPVTILIVWAEVELMVE